MKANRSFTHGSEHKVGFCDAIDNIDDNSHIMERSQESSSALHTEVTCSEICTTMD